MSNDIEIRITADSGDAEERVRRVGRAARDAGEATRAAGTQSSEAWRSAERSTDGMLAASIRYARQALSAAGSTDELGRSLIHESAGAEGVARASAEAGRMTDELARAQGRISDQARAAAGSLVHESGILTDLDREFARAATEAGALATAEETADRASDGLARAEGDLAARAKDADSALDREGSSAKSLGGIAEALGSKMASLGEHLGRVGDQAREGFRRAEERIRSFGSISHEILRSVVARVTELGMSGIAMGLSTASGLEQAMISYETLLHSADKARVHVSELTKFAASTPFELPGLIEADKALIGAGESASKTLGTLRAWGDASGALGQTQEQFDRTMIAVTQSMGKGKLQAEELMQITEAGIPIWSILSKAMGKPITELQNMVSKGQLLTKDVLPKLEKQMEKDYGGSMVKQSRTLQGVWSTLMDTINIGLATALHPLVPMLSAILPKAAAGVAVALGWVSGGLAGAFAWAKKNYEAGGIVRTVWEGICVAATGVKDAVGWARDRMASFVGWLHKSYDEGGIVHTVWGKIKDLALGIRDAVTWARDKIADLIGWFRNSAKEGGKVNLVWDALRLTALGIRDALGWIKDKLVDLGGWFKNSAKDGGNLHAAWDKLKAVGNLLKDAVAGIARMLGPLAKELMPWLITAGHNLRDAWNNLRQAFKDAEPLVRQMAPAFKAAAVGVGLFLGGLLILISALAVGLSAAIKGVTWVIDQVVKGIKGLLGVVLDVMSKMLDGTLAVVRAFARIPGPAGAPFRAMLGPLEDARTRLRHMQTDLDNLGKTHVTPTVTIKETHIANAETQVNGQRVSVRDYGDVVHMKTGGQTHTARAAGGVVGAAASGGLRSGLTLVGEHGPELAQLAPGTRITSNPDTMALLAGAGGGGGTHLHVEFSGPVGSSRELENWLEKAVVSLNRSGRLNLA